MTLGRKLAGYRKIAGLTQQQLGEHLNLSAQAISKWENDLAEPDLSALRALSELYKVSVDELLDLNANFIDVSGAEQAEEEEESAAGAPAAPIGFCKQCGITVTQENLGETDPVILCKKCVAAKIAEQKRAEQQRKQEELRRLQAEKARRDIYKGKLTRNMVWHLFLAGAAAVIFLACMIGAMTESFSVARLMVTLIGTYSIFGLIFCLFYDCWVQDVVIDWVTKAFQAPGLIFEFDLDGFLWLIGMKLLFWVIGILFSVVCGAIGIFFGLVIAPFVFPYVMHQICKSLKNGTECELSDEIM